MDWSLRSVFSNLAQVTVAALPPSLRWEPWLKVCTSEMKPATDSIREVSVTGTALTTLARFVVAGTVLSKVWGTLTTLAAGTVLTTLAAGTVLTTVWKDQQDLKILPQDRKSRNIGR